MSVSVRQAPRACEREGERGRESEDRKRREGETEKREWDKRGRDEEQADTDDTCDCQPIHQQIAHLREPPVVVREELDCGLGVPSKIHE